jgi:starvation-inducible DNA-binding protein
MAGIKEVKNKGKYSEKSAAKRVPEAKIKTKPTVEDLQATLYELISQKFAVHQAHWNVSGPLFSSLHVMFEDMYKEIEKIIDKVAERKVIIGEPADGRPEFVAKHAQLGSFPEGEITDVKALDLLTARYLQMSDRLAERLEETGETDLVSQDILLKVKNMIEIHLWKLRSCSV